MELAKSMALSTASFASGPFGRTLQRFIIPLYSPMMDADLQNDSLEASGKVACMTILLVFFRAQEVGHSGQTC